MYAIRSYYVKAWRDGGPACSGQFDEKGVWRATLTTRTTRFDQDGKVIIGVALTGCGEKQSNELKVGAISGAEAQVAEQRNNFV